MNRLTLTLGGLALLFAFTTGLFAWLYFTKRCPPCYDSGKTVIEYVQVKDSSLKPISVKVPVAKKIKRKGASVPVAKPDSIRIVAGDCDTTIILPPSPCSEVVVYSDTITGDSIKAVINDTLADNRIIGRSVWMVNLKPDTKITVVKRERWKFYVGASFTVNQRFMGRWGIGPSALLAIPKIGAISYTFDARNFAHTGGLYVLIRVKK